MVMNSVKPTLNGCSLLLTHPLNNVHSMDVKIIEKQHETIEPSSEKWTRILTGTQCTARVLQHVLNPLGNYNVQQT